MAKSDDVSGCINFAVLRMVKSDDVPGNAVIPYLIRDLIFKAQKKLPN
jgi:hypothetical protein